MDEVQRWRRWQRLFISRAGRELPSLDPLGQVPRISGLAVSLAHFQRREAAERAWRDDAGYCVAGRTNGRATAARVAAASALNNENRRHSHLLAIAVRLLGGELEQPNSFRFSGSKSANVEVFGRWRALASDVVSTAYYMSLAAGLPASRVQGWLAEIAQEKRTHVEFRSDTICLSGASIPALWIWRCVLAVSAASVLLRQRRLFRVLGISAGIYWGRCLALGDLAQKLVSGAARPRRPAFAYTAADGLT